ncbi:MAG TPA: serine--tRNA ligase [Candidatus Acidoferrales bacterium]|nr:serine--tRNA ligase [Candidatus Acidoferrales bacterium]
MLELAHVRENFDQVRKALESRGLADLDLNNFLLLDQQRRKAITDVEALKAERNRANAEIGQLKKEGKDASAVMEQMKQAAARTKELDAQAEALDQQLRELLLRIPNLPHASVPLGRTPGDNVEVRRWGSPPKFDFAPKAHWDLGAALGLLDFERASKLAGARFVVYTGAGARLERALASFMLDIQTRENGYREVLPPFAVNAASLVGTGQLPKFSGDLFRLEGTDFWLSPTAEVQITNLFRDETLDGAKLPLKLCAWTSNFRSEAGSYGKETRGIVRQHQFQKIELVKFARAEHSYDELESLTRDAESILQKLGLAYRVVALCTGDLGFSAAKTYDIEVWLPGHNEYKEISSCSNFETFQARRAGIRCRVAGKKGSEYAHTLNGSGLAVGRTWMAVIENYQQKDGSVVVPEVLSPYLGGLDRLTPDSSFSLDSYL